MARIKWQHPCRPRRAGFTLIETAIAMVIVGVAAVAVITLLAAGTMSNVASAQLTTAINLAENLREMTLRLPFADPQTPSNWGREANESATSVAAIDDLDDLNGRSFSPPIDARRTTLFDKSSWSQEVTVQTVKSGELTATTTNGSDSINRTTAVIKHNGGEIYRLSWLTANVQ